VQQFSRYKTKKLPFKTFILYKASKPFLSLDAHNTRKLCYSKDDRAMRAS